MQKSMEAKASCTEVRVFLFSAKTEAGAGRSWGCWHRWQQGTARWALWWCDVTALNLLCAAHQSAWCVCVSDDRGVLNSPWNLGECIREGVGSGQTPNSPSLTSEIAGMRRQGLSLSWACSFSALDTLLPVLSTSFTGTTRNSTKIGLGIVVPSSWPHGPCHVKVSCGGHWCTVPLTSSACMHTGKLALWCSMVSWRDVETVCKTPVTLKAGNSWETLHKKQNFLP